MRRASWTLAVALGFTAGSAALACSASSSPSSVTAPPEAGDDDAGDDAGADAAPVVGCPGDTPAAYAWEPPVPATTTACTEADLDRLDAAIAASPGGLSEKAIADALGPTCAACAVGRVDDPSWRAIVGGHAGYVGNVGGCTILLGAKETCGKAVDALSTCLIVACAGCGDRKAQNACTDALTTAGAPCASALSTMRKACPAAMLAAAFDTNGVCQSFTATVRLFCGPPPADAGSDAGAQDGG